MDLRWAAHSCACVCACIIVTGYSGQEIELNWQARTHRFILLNAAESLSDRMWSSTAACSAPTDTHINTSKQSPRPWRSERIINSVCVCALHTELHCTALMQHCRDRSQSREGFCCCRVSETLTHCSGSACWEEPYCSTGSEMPCCGRQSDTDRKAEGSARQKSGRHIHSIQGEESDAPALLFLRSRAWRGRGGNTSVRLCPSGTITKRT